MDQFVIVVETDYQRGSANYRIAHTEPTSQDEARVQYDALHAGTDPLLPPVDGAVVVDVADTQFLRLRKKLGAQHLDRVTLGPATIQ